LGEKLWPKNSLPEILWTKTSLDDKLFGRNSPWSIFSRSQSGPGPLFFIFTGPVPVPLLGFQVPVRSGSVFFIFVPVPNLRGPINSFFLITKIKYL